MWNKNIEKNILWNFSVFVSINNQILITDLKNEYVLQIPKGKL